MFDRCDLGRTTAQVVTTCTTHLVADDALTLLHGQVCKGKITLESSKLCCFAGICGPVSERSILLSRLSQLPVE